LECGMVGFIVDAAPMTTHPLSIRHPGVLRGITVRIL
jgi:hypothetical protein